MITIDHFKQVCDAMASNAKVYKVDGNDEEIKFQQEYLAKLPPDEVKKESRFAFFSKKVKPEKSERQKCLEKLDHLFSGKANIRARIGKLEQLKIEADQFVESQVNQHPEKKDEKTGKDMRIYEPISSDQLMHAYSILRQFVLNISDFCVGAQAGGQLKDEILKEVNSANSQAICKP